MFINYFNGLSEIMNVIFFENNKIEDKKNMTYGGTVRKYYSQLALKQAGNSIYYMDSLDSLRTVINYLFMENKLLWFHYPARRSISLIAICISMVTRKKLTLTIHDSPIAQQFALDGKKYTFLQRYFIKIIESVLIYYSNIIIIAAPNLLDYFECPKNKHIVIMPPGVGNDELNLPRITADPKKKRKVAIYFGSMKRGTSIPDMVRIFSKIREWELHLIGPSDGEEIVQSNNIKYFGQMDHESLIYNLRDADVVLIPYPVNDYLNICMPMKLGSALACCKPIITTRLNGISQYISYVDLNENAIYIDEWDETNVLKALKDAENLSIDEKDTLEKMNKMVWEPRFMKLIKTLPNNSKSSKPDNESIKWI